jgi:hypothetical protein
MLVSEIEEEECKYGDGWLSSLYERGSLIEWHCMKNDVNIKKRVVTDWDDTCV